MRARMRFRAARLRYRIRVSDYAPRHIMYGFTHPGEAIRTHLSRNSTPRTQVAKPVRIGVQLWLSAHRLQKGPR